LSLLWGRFGRGQEVGVEDIECDEKELKSIKVGDIYGFGEEIIKSKAFITLEPMGVR